MKLLLLAPLLASSVPAQELALSGNDPVALCSGEEIAGQAGIVEDWGLYRYRFVDESSREAFREDPERYAIQWDGGCARMGPLSGKGSPDRWTVYESRIYVFASDSCREGFLADPARFVAPPPIPVTATEEARAQGREWLEKALEAHGGEAVSRARTLFLRAEREVGGWKGEQELVAASNGAVERRSTWIPPDGEGERSDSVWVVDAPGAFGVDDGSVHDIASPQAREDVLRFAHRRPLFLLWARESAGFEAIHLGPGRFGGIATEDVLVRYQGLATTLHLDPETGLVLGLSWRGRANSGVTRDVVETFTDWLELDGIRIPSGRTVMADGEPESSLAATWTDVSVSAKAAPEAFRRPG